MSRPRYRRTSPPTSNQDYLASVSDLMSGLLFIFVITLMVFALRLAKKQEELGIKANQLDALEKGITSGKATARGIGSSIVKAMDAVGCKSVWEPTASVVHLPSEALRFEIGEDHPEQASSGCVGVLAAALVEALSCHVSSIRSDAIDASALSEHPGRPSWCNSGKPMDPAAVPCGKGSVASPVVETLLIEGHTDSRVVQGGRFRDNLDLSAARASEVLRMMRACEPGLDRLRNASGQPVVSVTGYADMRLADTADPWASGNRRIDLRVLMELPKERSVPVAASRGTP